MHVDLKFFGRQGGTSPRPWDSLNASYDVGDVKTRVDENRARIAHKMGVASTALYTVKQVHGVKAIQVHAGDDPERIRAIEADAVWTKDPNVAVGVLTADCVPVLFYSKNDEVIGAIHAGWRGAVAGVVTKTLCDLGGDFNVVIGPCAGFEKFEVGPEVIAAVTVDLEGITKPSTGDKMFLDLPALIERQLKLVGIESVENQRRCTMTETNIYFSHRTSHGKCGRQMSVIVKHL